MISGIYWRETMKLQNYSQNIVPQKLQAQTRVKPAVSFTATLPEIREAMDTTQNKHFCAGKRGFVDALVKFFEGVQAEMGKMKDAVVAKLDYKLGQKNNIPEALKDVKIDSPLKDIPLMKGAQTLEEVDNVLATAQFKCSPTSTCGCGKNIPLGEYIGKGVFGDILGVKNKPEVIELDASK